MAPAFHSSLPSKTILVFEAVCRKPSPAEEVLFQALREARRNVLKLEDMKKAVERAIENEERQFERVQFAFKRAQSDAAHIRTLQKLRAQDRLRLEELQELEMVEDLLGQEDELLN